MKPVIQLEQTGCGIAAVATIAGVSYRQAQGTAKRLGIVAADPRLWSQTAQVRQLLREYRLHAAEIEQPFRSWKHLPDLALLAIKWHGNAGWVSWHWVVFERKSGGGHVLDSRKALHHHVRTDFWRMKPKWYITVDGKGKR